MLAVVACDLGDHGDGVADDGADEGAVEGGRGDGDAEPMDDATGVQINGRPVSAAALAMMEAQLYAQIPAGAYWYDARSGLGGPWGGYARVYAPGLDFGPVPTDASHGDTGIYYNGRELPRAEALLVAWLFGIPEQNIPLFAGRYVLESTGDLFTEDGIWLGNLAVLAAQAGGGPGSSDGCTAVRIPSSAPNPTGVPQTIDVATGTNC